MKTIFGILLVGIPAAWGQSVLSLSDAVRAGLEHHPAVLATQEATKAAQNRVEQARSGLLPKVNYSESYQRSNNPVFVFGSLLEQHQFAQQNFDLQKLNYPNFLNNFQSTLSVDQTLFDAGATKSQVRSAQLGTQIASEDERGSRMRTVASVVGAYFGAILGQERLKVSDEAVRSAEADLKQAENVRTAGLSTDADVLSVRVHLAAMKERQIQARYGVDTALASLNDALGQPLATRYSLSTPLTPAALHDPVVAELDKSAVEERPEARQAALSTQVAEEASKSARSAWFPKVSVNGAFEADRQRFVTRGGANWTVALGLNWNLFNGFSDRARNEETAHLVEAARARAKQTQSAVQLQVQQAYANWRSAQERIGVAQAAVSMAEESRRITRNRYDAGLTTINELLRNETALLEAQTRSLEAIYDQRIAAAALELAAGTLSGESDAAK